jgi:hypothetical protein
MQGDIKLSVIMFNAVMPIVIMLSNTVPYLAAAFVTKTESLTTRTSARSPSPSSPAWTVGEEVPGTPDFTPTERPSVRLVETQGK